MVAKRKRDTAEQARPASALKKSGTVSVKAQERAPAKSKSQEAATVTTTNTSKSAASLSASGVKPWTAETTTIQIITGSYDRVLHGFTAAIPQSLVTGPGSAPREKEKEKEKEDQEAAPIAFSDTFLFNAHGSAIRCLALSPAPEDPNGKLLLATGSTDERINVYSVSLCPPAVSNRPKLPSLSATSITENSKNKELGTLLHHSSSITALCFPTRSKLLSSAEDSTIAITRTRDWEPLSSIKAPIPKPQGRPSGDTAGPGEIPAGVTDFAIHPSMKLMVSVSKGEKCMRLWNLVTGKKAGVLSFSRDILTACGEGRFASGEGRRVLWDGEGEEFTVAFERGAAVFGIDCKLKAHIVPTPRTKLHQLHYLPGRRTAPKAESTVQEANILAISTEDGRLMFYNTTDLPKPKEDGEPVPCTLVAQLGGPATGITGRVKDFEIMPVPDTTGEFNRGYLVIAGSSDGSVRLWSFSSEELVHESVPAPETAESGYMAKQIGKLIGTYSTGTRITCLKAFVMTGNPETADEPEEKEDVKNESSSDEDSE